MRVGFHMKINAIDKHQFGGILLAIKRLQLYIKISKQ